VKLGVPELVQSSMTHATDRSTSFYYVSTILCLFNVYEWPAFYIFNLDIFPFPIFVSVLYHGVSDMYVVSPA